MDFIAELKHQLVVSVEEIFHQKISSASILIQPTNPEHTGDFTVLMFPLAKLKLGVPEEIGYKIGEHLVARYKPIDSFVVIKGFLNLVIRESYWWTFLEESLEAEEFFFRQHIGNNQRVMVEYSSPNTNKPLHLGHLRNMFLGSAVSKILEALGYTVIRACLYNDRGIHICKSMLAWKLFGNGETPASSGIKGDHLVGKYYVLYERVYQEQLIEARKNGVPEETAKEQVPIYLEIQEMLRKWETSDPEVRDLWKMMNHWVYDGFQKTYQRLGIHFDQFYYESNTYLLGKEIVEEGLKKGVFYKKIGGSIWINLFEEGLDEKLLLRSDGTSVYITQDLGTADKKYHDHRIQKSIYVIGDEQDYHMKTLIAILQKLGKSYASGLYHLSYGMVDLPSGKMKSREGTVVDADDLLDEMHNVAKTKTEELGKAEGLNNRELNDLYETLGQGALKYFLLKVDAKKRILFDPSESIDFRGNTGVYIQFMYARIKSLLNKGSQEAFEVEDISPLVKLLPLERELLRCIHQYRYELIDAGQTYNPAVIANYLYELAKLFSRFYNEVPIFKEPNKSTVVNRLFICKMIGEVLYHGLGLLGIKAPNRM